MAESISAGSAHLHRLHHHRDRVRRARQAVTDAAQTAVATHYDHTRSAGPSISVAPPAHPVEVETPPAAETPTTGPLGAEREAPDE